MRRERQEIRFEPSGYGLVWCHLTIRGRTFTARGWREKTAYLAALAAARDAQEGRDDGARA